MATTPNPAITMTPAQIAEQVKAMNVQAMNSAANTAMSPQANKGGSVAQMQQQAQTPAETIAKAQAQPGVMQLGATTGTTNAAPGQLPAVPTQFQAVTGAGATMDAASLKQMKETEARNEASRQAELNRLKQSSAAGTTSYYDAASGTWKQGSSPETQKIQAETAATTPTWDAQAGTWKTGTATVGTAGATGAGATSAGTALIDKQMQDLKEQAAEQQRQITAMYDQQIRARAAQQKSESAQSAMMLARMGGIGMTTASGVSYTQSLDAQHAQELGQLEQAKQNALAAAQAAATNQNNDLLAKKIDEMNAIDERAQTAMTNRLNNLQKAQAVQDKSYQDLAAAGLSVTDFPDGYFKHQDDALNSYGIAVPPGTSEAAFIATKKAYSLKQEADAATRATQSRAVAKDIQSIVQNLMPGQTIPIGDGTYFGTSGGGVVEADSSGHARMLITTADGKQEIHDLGPIGKASDITRVMHNGKEMAYNNLTQQYTDISGEQTLRHTILKFFPSGQKTPLASTECGGSWNIITDNKAGHAGDSLESKVALTDPKLTKDDIVAGDSFVMSTNKPYGHIGFINEILDLPDGRKQYTLSESNWDGKGTWTNDRKMFSDDPRLKGYISTHDKLPYSIMNETASLLSTKTPTAQITPTATVINGLTIPNSPLTTFSGTPAAYEKLQEAEKSAATDAQALISGQMKLKDLPASDRARAIEIATANGWSQQKAEAGENPFAKGLIDGTVKITDIPMAERGEALSLAQKAGYTPEGNSKFQKISDTAKMEFRDLLTMEDQIRTLETLKSTGAEGREQDTGPLAAGTNAMRGWINMANQNLLDIDATTQDLKSNIMKQRSGAAVQEAEVKRLSKFLPTVSDNDQVFNRKMRHLRETYNTMLQNQAKIYGFADLDAFKKQFGIGTAEATPTPATNTVTVTSPDGASRVTYDLSDPAQKAEHEEALKAGYK